MKKVIEGWVCGSQIDEFGTGLSQDYGVSLICRNQGCELDDKCTKIKLTLETIEESK